MDISVSKTRPFALISPRAASRRPVPAAEDLSEVVCEGVVFPDFQSGAFHLEMVLVFVLGNIGEITLVIDELARPLLPPTPFDFPVNRADMPAELVGDPPFRPTGF